MSEENAEINRRFGWHFFCHQVSEFTKETFWGVMARPAAEVFGVGMVIQAKSGLNKISNDNGT